MGVLLGVVFFVVFFSCLKLRVMVMISATNMIVFMMVHLSTSFIGRLMFSVSRNTITPAMLRVTVARSQSVWVFFCFVGGC